MTHAVFSEAIPSSQRPASDTVPGSDSSAPHPGALPEAATDPRCIDVVEGLVALLELARDVGICSDLDTLLHRIEATALPVLKCERLTVFVSEPVTNDLRSRLATGAHEIRTPVHQGIAAATFTQGSVINVRDASADPRFNDEIDKRTGYCTRSLLSVPLRGINNEIIGVLELLNKRSGAFTQSDEDLALTLGSLTGVTLQRQILFDEYHEKQRLEHDLQLARYIQRSLLPVEDPRLQGYDLAGWSQAAAATGGDFYDYLELPDGRLGLIVADVAGHGFAASLLACETRALIQSAALSAGSVADIAASANTLLYRDLRNERFVVLFLGALDLATGRLGNIGAGCAPLVYRADERRFASVDSTVPPLAVRPRLPDGASCVLTLRPGDVVVMVTDGFYEWENERGDEFGMERLRGAVAANAGRRASELIECLHADVRRFAGGAKQVDDLTAIVVARAPVAALPAEAGRADDPSTPDRPRSSRDRGRIRSSINCDGDIDKISAERVGLEL